MPTHTANVKPKVKYLNTRMRHQRGTHNSELVSCSLVPYTEASKSFYYGPLAVSAWFSTHRGSDLFTCEAFQNPTHALQICLDSLDQPNIAS